MSLRSILAAASAALVAPPAMARTTSDAKNQAATKPANTSAPSISQSMVKKLQRRLIQTGYLQTGKMTASGHWDKKTAHAVALFQKDYGLTVNGKPDDATLKALNLQTGNNSS